MTELTKLQKSMAADLLKCIANGVFQITYGDLAKPYGVDPHRVVGNQIGEISKRCYELGLPLISVMVVSKDTFFPGTGFKGLCDCLQMYMDKNEVEVWRIEQDRVEKCSDWYKLADDIGVDIPGIKKPIIDYVAESFQSESLLEGKPIQINATVYERNPELRKACLETKGTKCAICGFDAAEKYGTEFDGRIHVHHIVPLSDKKYEQAIDPIKDLIPVCPNCHMILHAKEGGTFTPDEVKKMLH